jgi:hypothetical protein
MRDRSNGFVPLLSLLLILLFGGVSHSAPILPGHGISFAQDGFDYPGVSPQPFSEYGQVFADYATLASNGFGNGYINVVTSGGWAVQNLPVQALAGYPGLATFFDLGAGANGTPVSSLSAYVNFSATPLNSAPIGAATNYNAGNGSFATTVTINAEGDAGNGTRTTNPGAPQTTGAITFGNGQNSVTFQPGHTNVEQDVNQCGPGSVANSLDYLRNRYGVNVPATQTNTPGIAGQPPNSLVGQLDSTMGRAQGQGVTNQQFIDGKLQYLANNKVSGLIVEHQGGDGAIGTGDVNFAGLTSHYDGKVNANWIIGQIQAGEDVEMNVRWTSGGGHWVDLIAGGYINGVPWVAYVNDANQGYDPMTMTTAINGGVGLFDGGYDFSFLTTDAMGNVMFRNFVDGASARVNFVVAESVPEPCVIALLLIGLGAFLLLRKRVCVSR